MARELEIRFLDVDIGALTKRLEKLGATKVGTWFQERFIFQLDNTKRCQKWIRLRTNGEKSTIAYKHIHHVNKIDGTEEIEFEVDDFHAATQFLEKCGFIKEGPQQNKRTRYILDGVEIDIDTWPNCPPWVEIEGKTETEIKKTCAKLELDFKRGTTLGVLDVLVGYGYDRNQKVCKF
jgi:adenylate cyclase class 2